MELFLWLSVAVIGLGFSAVFSGVETGIYCVNRLRLAVRAGTTPPDQAAARLQQELNRPERLIATLLIGNNAANYAGSLGLTALLVMAGLTEWAVIVVNAVILTPALFVIGETIPKDLFRAEADRLTPRFSTPLRLFRWLATITLLLPTVTTAAWLLQKLIGGERLTPIEHRQRIGALLKEGASGGVLSPEQTTLIDRALVVGDMPIADAMRAWSRAQRIGVDWSRERMRETARRAGQSGQARIPVVDRRGKVVGLARTIDVALAEEGASAASMASSAVEIDAGESVRQALRLFATEDISCAVVAAEGEPVGLVTYDDLLDPLLGLGAFRL